jgi:elongation factor G
MKPVLLEPIMLMEIECPEEYQGTVVGNISSRRGMIVSTDRIEGNVSKIMAEVPLAETFGYATDIRSMTKGQGTFTMELSGYRPVPASLQTEIVADRKAEQELVGAR